MNQFESRKRTALDGRTWWCIWDNEKRDWSSLTCFGKYKTKYGAEIAIKYYEEFLNGE